MKDKDKGLQASDHPVLQRLWKEVNREYGRCWGDVIKREANVIYVEFGGG